MPHPHNLNPRHSHRSREKEGALSCLRYCTCSRGCCSKGSIERTTEPCPPQRGERRSARSGRRTAGTDGPCEGARVPAKMANKRGKTAEIEMLSMSGSERRNVKDIDILEDNLTVVKRTPAVREVVFDFQKTPSRLIISGVWKAHISTSVNRSF